MQAMVLAAGLGTRLWPLTADRAKPAVPFLGRPLVAGVVAHLRAHGVDRIVVNTHHRAASIRDALAHEDVAFSHEDPILGTAGALAKARDDRLLDPTAPTLIANGKLFTDLDLTKLFAHHAATNAAVTMGLRSNLAREHFREVLVENGVVVGFGEGRIPKGERPWSFTGLHVVGPEVLAQTEAVFSDTVRDVYPPFIDASRVHACVLDQGRWWELSTLERYHALHVRAAEEGLADDVVCDSTATIADGATVRRSVLWAGARVESGAHVENAVLGAGVRVGADERIESVVLVARSVVEQNPPDESVLKGAADGDRWRVELEC